tara:strand:- start:683 stop:2323 length:1641 start_codon:yes stop_codon:yes gene_type:complete
MKKRITFNTHDRDGNWFAETVDVMPRSGGGMAKIAGEMHPEVSLFLRGLKPDPKYQYVLMTPMGSFEYWGMNVNGDVFPDVSLSYNHCAGSPREASRIALELERKWLTPHRKTLPPGDWSKFGYKTFEDAHRYRHHINKDPEIAYGDIVLAVWNKAMHRAEVIARHDREKAKQVGAEEIIQDLDEGKPRQISMGCRVKFDVCTICSHISRTQRDYCDHLRTMMGRVQDDGKIVGAVNFFPVFFDLSDVIVPAAKESGVLMKVAGMGMVRRGGIYVPRRHALDAPNQLIKTASRPLLIKAAKNKAATIIKKVIPNSGYALARRAAGVDADLPKDLLREGSFQGLLSTLALLGIILKPREFQYSLLSRKSPDLAERLHDSGHVFRPRPANTSVSLSADDFDRILAGKICPHIRSRSAFQPHIGSRVIRITMIKSAGLEVPVEEKVVESNDGFDKIGSAYTAYRNSMLTLPAALEVAVREHFGYYQQNFFGDLLDRAMTKTAAITDLVSQGELTAGYLCGAFRDAVCSDPWVAAIRLQPHSPASLLLGS